MTLYILSGMILSSRNVIMWIPGQYGIFIRVSVFFLLLYAYSLLIRNIYAVSQQTLHASVSCKVNQAYENQAAVCLPYLITKIPRQNRNSKTHQNTISYTGENWSWILISIPLLCMHKITILEVEISNISWRTLVYSLFPKRGEVTISSNEVRRWR